MKIRKSHLTLLELLISMALTTVILTVLTYFYQQIYVMGIEMDRVQEESFVMRYVENKLGRTLPYANSAEPNQPFLFFTGDESPLFKQGTDNLIFTFDNRVQLDKSFSAIILGRLYVTADGLFCLSTWPSPKDWSEWDVPPMKREVLMTNVESLKFQFYAPPEKGAADIGRVKLWGKDEKRLPSIVWITLKQFGEERPITFAYPLPKSAKPITYGPLS